MPNGKVARSTTDRKVWTDPLALGNVATLRKMLDEKDSKFGHIRIIGTGGVLDAAGFRRMKAVGASVVGVGTGLGLKGLAIFKEIEDGLV